MLTFFLSALRSNVLLILEWIVRLKPSSTRAQKRRPEEKHQLCAFIFIFFCMARPTYYSVHKLIARYAKSTPPSPIPPPCRPPTRAFQPRRQMLSASHSLASPAIPQQQRSCSFPLLNGSTSHPSPLKASHTFRFYELIVDVRSAGFFCAEL